MPLTEALFALRDENYRAFQQKLIPNLDSMSIIGVRTPQLRELAKKMEERDVFLNSLPHRYFEENQIHAFLLEREQDFSFAILQVDRFLPYVDNWATCDQLRPRVFRKNTEALLPYIRKWLASDHPYTIRYGIAMLMCHFLDSSFKEEYPAMVAQVHHQDYYVKMMAAWYFATALAKQYDAVYPYITEYRLDPWIHRKAIQKAVESYRITPERKAVLKMYRE